jgi:hypothetical protein
VNVVIRTWANGTVVFENLPDRDANGVYRVYWFEETEKEGIGQFDQLVLLALPVEKITGSPGANHDIHIAVRQVFKNYRPIGASGFSTYSAYWNFFSSASRQIAFECLRRERPTPVK